jgi:hypothetical protein
MFCRKWAKIAENCHNKTSASVLPLSEFELTFKGSDALERKGVFYAISEKDHPITKLMQAPYKAPRKSNVLVSLTTRQVGSYHRTLTKSRFSADALSHPHRVKVTKCRHL